MSKCLPLADSGPLLRTLRYYAPTPDPRLIGLFRVAKAHALPVGQASKMMSNPVGFSCNLQASPPQLRYIIICVQKEGKSKHILSAKLRRSYRDIPLGTNWISNRCEVASTRVGRVKPPGIKA